MDVRRSVREPVFDAEVNVVGTIRLLQGCVEHEVDVSFAERVLGWRPEVRLPVGLKETFRFFAAV